jgi:hypothetical protein
MPVRKACRHGDWLFTCQKCGFSMYGSEAVLEWTGLRGHAHCIDKRHPQEYLRGRRDDQTVPFANPPATPNFLETNEVTPESL